jgi:hypothetical protein
MPVHIGPIQSHPVQAGEAGAAVMIIILPSACGYFHLKRDVASLVRPPPALG